MLDDLRSAYHAEDSPAIRLGSIVLDDQLQPESPVYLLLKSFNRHGLIAGATGTGKTKTMQVLCEQLALAGVPSLVMDIKGDVSGLAMPAQATEVINARSKALNLAYVPRAFPVELLTLNDVQPGVPLRATVSDFGPVLFARMLDVNETQAGIVTVLFEYAKECHIPLNDLHDFKALLYYAQTPAGKIAIEARFGSIATTSLGTIIRKIIELQAQGSDSFFGNPAFHINDLLRKNAQGLGIISIIRLLDMQDKPKLFSTFMLKLLSDAYKQMPELGDIAKPELVIFIDEAHLIFNNASKALLNLLETMVKLIRSKGVGLIFCTQTPNDIPEAVLSQLGLKIQHALRAFTAKDRTAMKLIAQNFPPSQYYNTEQLLTALGIGDALVSSLNGKGQPTPLIECRIRAPESRMGILTEKEMVMLASHSTLRAVYGQRQQLCSAQDVLAKQTTDNQQTKTATSEKPSAKQPSFITILTKNTLFRQIIRQIFREITRSILSIFSHPTKKRK